MPSWFVASDERSMVRAADIATEMELKNPVVVGAQEGWRAIPALKRMGATAVVSFELPVSGRSDRPNIPGNRLGKIRNRSATDRGRHE
jgi:hypothetical protein